MKTENKGRLFLIPNVLAPGTSSQVLPPQIKNCIEETDYYFAEEIRTARRFLSELKISRPIESLFFFEVNKDTSAETIKSYFAQVPSGKNIGVISEAGCPGIADPGAMAVDHAHKIGMEVCPLVGPSSILLALIGSGLNGQSFEFHGYLPIQKAERAKAIRDLESESRKTRKTQIFMETPYRNNQMLEDIMDVCAGPTHLCLAASLTSEAQYIKTRKIIDWRGDLPDLHKKPAIFLLQV
ncbi:MAG TPA: SAM-dependent methyltransferase [Cytophagaceae bacterium]|jgi:16S rRNA (cytidine1402-2'-O)-methyltransferase|nr:SAM-dependent methyltransferase [Cytophagaceae bacterium]